MPAGDASGDPHGGGVAGGRAIAGEPTVVVASESGCHVSDILLLMVTGSRYLGLEAVARLLRLFVRAVVGG